MRKAAAAVAVTMLASTGLWTVGAAPASADTPNCVSRTEFSRIYEGMTKARVHAIFDINGTFGDGGAGGYSRLYKECRNLPAGDGCWAAIEYSTMTGRAITDGWKRWNAWCTNG